MNLFNAQGQLNATDIKDAVAKISKFASVMESMPSGIEIPKMSEAQQDALINAAIYSNEGKHALANIMANPIRQNLDYRGLARRLLIVDPVGPGVEPSYELDIDVSATVIADQGTTVESRVWGERAKVATWIIRSRATITIQQARLRRFNAIDRIIQKMKQEISAVEDASVFAGADAAAQQINVLTDIDDAGMTKKNLLNIKRQIDNHDLVTAKFLMNINEFNDILQWGAGGGQGLTGGEFDPVTMREVLQTGLYATLWGAEILVSKIVPVGTVYGFADPDFVGVMPVREDVTVYPCDEMSQGKLGWMAQEEVGFAFLVQRGVAAARKSLVAG